MTALAEICERSEREKRPGWDPGLYVDRWVVLTSNELQNGREETGCLRQGWGQGMLTRREVRLRSSRFAKSSEIWQNVPFTYYLLKDALLEDILHSQLSYLDFNHPHTEKHTCGHTCAPTSYLFLSWQPLRFYSGPKAMWRSQIASPDF